MTRLTCSSRTLKFYWLRQQYVVFDYFWSRVHKRTYKVPKSWSKIYTSNPWRTSIGIESVSRAYGPNVRLSRSRDYSGRTVSKHGVKSFGIHNTINASSLYFKSVEYKLICICATYVDDIIHLGSSEEFSLTQKTEKRFQWKPSELDNIMFSSIEILSKNVSYRFRQQKHT